jgi:hypothetical protein
LAAFPEEFRLVNFVAVMGLGGGIPGNTIGFMVFFFHHYSPRKTKKIATN